MTKAELAAEFVFDLYSDAEGVSQAARGAQAALRAGNPAAALRQLEQVRQYAEHIEMHLADALRCAKEASDAA